MTVPVFITALLVLVTLCISGGRVYRFDEHVARMLDSARSMGFKNIPSRDYIRDAVLKTLQGNMVKVTRSRVGVGA